MNKFITFIVALTLASCGAENANTVKVESVSLNKSSLSLVAGNTEQLVATIDPEDATNQNVTWSSSNEEFVTVDQQGVVTAVKAGNATVTVKTVDGGKTATCSVKVSNPVVLQSIALSNKKTNYIVGDAFVKPTVTATFSDGHTEEVTNDTTFTGHDLTVAGGYTITASYSYKGVTKTATYTILVTSQPAAGDYTLFTQEDLEIDSFVVFAGDNSGSTYAMSTEQRTNNRGSSSITISNSSLTPSTGVAQFTVKEGTKDGTYSFYDDVNKGYLYAAGNSTGENYLRTSSTKSDNSSFKVLSNNNGQIKLVAQGTNSHNTIKFNSSSSNKIFSCYREDSSTGKFPYLFYKENVPVYATAIDIVGLDEVAINESINLALEYTPSNTNKKNPTWTSSNTSVATVSKGVVRGVSEGTTTITASVVGENGELITNTKQITVKRVSVESVSLNKTSAEISFNRTLELKATVAPNNATNKNVSWKSSDTSIATVSQNGLVTANASKTGTTTITVETEDGKKTATCSVSVVETVYDEWTIMVHMSGSNLESDGGAASEDIKEALSITGQPDDVNILYQTGGTTKWYSMNGYIQGASSISKDRVQRWEVQNQKIVLKDDSLGQQNMSDGKTLENFIKWGVSNYPAEKYAVILWNHGGGMCGVCIDDNYSSGWSYDYLTNSEVNTAMKNVFADSSLPINGKFEFIGYDACLMQVQDIAEFNSEYFNYMVASEELENGDGWDYECWIDDLYAHKDTETILTNLCDGFVSQYGSSRNDQTLSWLDLSQMSAYHAAWENMSKVLINNVKSYGGSNFRSFMNSVKDYDTVGSFDAKDFLNKLKNNSTLYNGLSDLVSKVETAFSNLVKHSAKGGSAGNSNGLCLYFDSTGDCNPSTEYKTSETHFVEWRQIVITYGYNA